MCVIITSRDANYIDPEIVLAGEKGNGDGGGLAWVENGRVRYKKAIKAKEIIELINSGAVTPPYVIHFRIATVGGPLPELTHPFAIEPTVPYVLEGESDAVLAHNGHFSGWKKALLNNISPQFRLPEGEWSDTRVMAFLASIHGHKILELLDEKIVTLDKEGKVTIYNYSMFYTHNQEDGSKLILSNTMGLKYGTYNGQKSTTTSSYKGNPHYSGGSFCSPPSKPMYKSYDSYDDYLEKEYGYRGYPIKGASYTYEDPMSDDYWDTRPDPWEDESLMSDEEYFLRRDEEEAAMLAADLPETENEVGFSSAQVEQEMINNILNSENDELNWTRLAKSKNE